MIWLPRFLSIRELIVCQTTIIKSNFKNAPKRVLFSTVANTSVRLARMALTAQRNVAVRITANATTPMECVCVNPATPGRLAPPGCVLKETTASCARGNAHATL